MMIIIIMTVLYVDDDYGHLIDCIMMTTSYRDDDDHYHDCIVHG